MQIKPVEDIRKAENLSAGFVVDDAKKGVTLGFHHVYPVNAAADRYFLPGRQGDGISRDIAVDPQFAVGNLKVALAELLDDVPQKQQHIVAQHLKPVEERALLGFAAAKIALEIGVDGGAHEGAELLRVHLRIFFFGIIYKELLQHMMHQCAVFHGVDLSLAALLDVQPIGAKVGKAALAEFFDLRSGNG